MTGDDARAVARRVRVAYDGLGAGPCAVLRRCRTAAELHQEGWFWRVVGDGDVAREDAWWIAHLVACFPTAKHRDDERFELGAHLRRRIYGESVKLDDLPKRAIAFRRLLAARDRDDVVHQLRRLLLRASQPRDMLAGADWGFIGHDLRFFGDAVRRRWAAGFYTADGASADDNGRESGDS